MIRQITLATLPNKLQAHIFENNMVALYRERNYGAAPPEQYLPYGDEYR